jgi:F-type H+/Na+-transporting ATPase subunit alpha
MALSLYAVNSGYLDDVPADKVVPFEAGLHAHARANDQGLLDRINATGDFDDSIEAEMKQLIEGFKSTGTY